MENIEEIKPGERPEYMNMLTRNQCSAITKVQSRLIPEKENHRATHKDTNSQCGAKTPERHNSIYSNPAQKQLI